jgi:haloalkane dehalogenase
LAEADVPKLFINAEPGAVVNDRSRQLIRTWPNLTEITVSGVHFVQEDSPDEIGTAIADFVRTNRATYPLQLEVDQTPQVLTSAHRPAAR